jgi:hypothetical protein
LSRLPAAVLALAAAMAAAVPAHAQEVVPSCYRAARLPVPPPRPVRSVFVLVDQTTSLEPELTGTISQNFERLLGPGTTFAVAKFSAFSRGHFTTIVSAGTIEAPVPARLRPSLPVNRLLALDRCLASQRRFAIRVAQRALSQAMSVPATTFSHSEIMASLAHLSERVRLAPAADRIVIVASDLMEHSGAASFYARRNLRLIDPAAELTNAARLGLLGNFGRARVYVIGTGMLPEEAGSAVRDIRALNALIGFWTSWFNRSNASRVTIGRPNIVAPIR